MSESELSLVLYSIYIACWKNYDNYVEGCTILEREYSKEISNQTMASNSNQQPHTNLLLDLEMTRGDDDNIAPYAKAQTPVSQEAVMRGIVSELHRHEAKLILLRASDPLDERSPHSIALNGSRKSS